jgi:hypothetical protein
MSLPFPPGNHAEPAETPVAPAQPEITEWNRRREVSEEIADLIKANLRGAKLIAAGPSEANLGEVKLREAILRRANLSYAECWRTAFDDVDLSQVEATHSEDDSTDGSRAQHGSKLAPPRERARTACDP